MVKRNKPIFFRALLLLALFLLVEAAVLMYINRPGTITGHSITDISDVYEKFYPNSKIFLIIQWSVIAILIIFVYLKNSGIRKRNKEVSRINVSSAIKNSKTNLDALYSILQKEKSLSLKTVANLFEIETDLAMEWARVLEAGRLVTIDYPGIGSPVLKVVEEVEEKTSSGDSLGSLDDKKDDSIKPTEIISDSHKSSKGSSFKSKSSSLKGKSSSFKGKKSSVANRKSSVVPKSSSKGKSVISINKKVSHSKKRTPSSVKKRGSRKKIKRAKKKNKKK